MLSVSQLTEKYVSLNPEIETCLREGLINYSSLARQIAATYGLPSADAAFAASRRLAEKLTEATPRKALTTAPVRPSISSSPVRAFFFRNLSSHVAEIPNGRCLPTLSPEQPLIILEPVGEISGLGTWQQNVTPEMLELVHCILTYPSDAVRHYFDLIADAGEAQLKPKFCSVSSTTVELLLTNEDFTKIEQLFD